MKAWKVTKFVDGKWELVGVYNDNFAEQMAAAISSLTKAGFEMYKTIRVEEVTQKEEAKDG